MDTETAAHIETLESHVAFLTGVIHVILNEIEAGTIQETASQIRNELETFSSK